MTKQEYEATIAELRERHEAFVRKIREQAGDERFTDAYSINRIIALCDAHAPEPPAFLRRQTTDYECAISMLAAQTVAKSKLLGENLVLKARIADLEARLATAEGEVVRLREPWQPIETAPRDGRLLLCASMTNQLHGYYDRAVLRYISELQGWSCPGLSGLSPTHWQPLPAPPERAGK